MDVKLYRVIDKYGKTLATSYERFEAEYWLSILPSAVMITESIEGESNES